MRQPPLRYYAISSDQAIMEPVTKTTSDEGYITTLHSYTYTETGISSVFAGTSEGYVIKVPL